MLMEGKTFKPQNEGSACVTFCDDAKWLLLSLHLVWVSAVIFIMYWEHMQSFSGETSLISMWQTEVILPSCCSYHNSCSTMCFSSAHYNNNCGHVAASHCLFVDFCWIPIFAGKVWGLSRQWRPCHVWICFQKCLFWVCWRSQKLVWSQELLWKARRATSEGDKQPSPNLPEEHHQSKKYQQLHLVAGRGGRGGEPGTCHKWVKYTNLFFSFAYCVLDFWAWKSSSVYTRLPVRSYTYRVVDNREIIKKKQPL